MTVTFAYFVLFDSDERLVGVAFMDVGVYLRSVPDAAPTGKLCYPLLVLICSVFRSAVAPQITKYTKRWNGSIDLLSI